MDFNAASQRLVRFSLQAQLSACSNHDLPYLKYFDTHRDSRVREGDDAGRVPPFATSIGMIAALTKDKNAVVALNNVNGGGRKRIDEFFINFALIRTLYRAHDKR